MTYRSLRACVDDLRRHGHLLTIDEDVDAHLEAAEIHRRVFASQGPALLFTRVTGTPFPMVSNLFGTMERMQFIFRETLDTVRRLIELKIDPSRAMRSPWTYSGAAFHALRMLPRRVRSGPVLQEETSIDQIPRLQSWPGDGGPFMTLPLVYTEHAQRPGWMHSNLGMYRIQLQGNEYATNREVGLHYQIHRGIGVHHQAALQQGQPFRVNVFVGGTPAMTVAAVMPLPESLSELTFAGALAGHRIPLISRPSQLPIYADADFCLVGTVAPDRLLPEGPFGDHLGYYSLQHLFPVLRVEKVWHRRNAIWPFTVVGRPPQEDTLFGQFIHEITGPVIPTLVAGLRAVHAVDAAGVHPLMLAIGSERYTPFDATTGPREILTQANAILGHGQMSLAKYLLIASGDDDRQLTVDDVPRFFQHILERVDFTRDVHFHTRTSVDTLDYTGSALNEGSKVVLAAAGPRRRPLGREVPDLSWPAGFSSPQRVGPGVLAVQGPAVADSPGASQQELRRFCGSFDASGPLMAFPLVVIVDDSRFTAATWRNFLWVSFTRSDPASDIDGVEAFTENKHWGCRGSLVIDARMKPGYPPPLESDPEIIRRVDARAARGGPLARWL